MAETTEAELALQLRVETAWSRAMDEFYESLDNIIRHHPDFTEEGVIKAVRYLIDDETADAYEEWIQGE